VIDRARIALLLSHHTTQASHQAHTSFNEGLGTFAIATTKACGDEIRNSSALEESGVLDCSKQPSPRMSWVLHQNIHDGYDIWQLPASPVGYNICASFFISIRPTRMMAALLLLPMRNPSTNPAPE